MSFHDSNSLDTDNKDIFSEIFIKAILVDLPTIIIEESFLNDWSLERLIGLLEVLLTF